MTQRPQKDRGCRTSRSDPVVHARSPPYRQQTRHAPDPTRTHYCMVLLATRASSRRQTCTSQVTNATVMLGENHGDHLRPHLHHPVGHDPPLQCEEVANRISVLSALPATNRASMISNRCRVSPIARECGVAPRSPPVQVHAWPARRLARYMAGPHPTGARRLR